MSGKILPTLADGRCSVAADQAGSIEWGKNRRIKSRRPLARRGKDQAENKGAKEQG